MMARRGAELETGTWQGSNPLAAATATGAATAFATAGHRDATVAGTRLCGSVLAVAEPAPPADVDSFDAG